MDPLLNNAYDAYTLLALLCFAISGYCLVKAILILSQRISYIYRRRVHKRRYGFQRGAMAYQFHFGLHSLYVYFVWFNLARIVDKEGRVQIKSFF